jgi:hypothetical protein
LGSRLVERSDVLRAAGVLGPILVMLALGTWLALGSGTSRASGRAGVRVVVANFTQVAALVTGCLIAMIVLQEFVGYRLTVPW